MRSISITFAATTMAVAGLTCDVVAARGVDTACKASGKLQVVVELQTPEAQPAGGLKMTLRYPTASVSLPGVGEVATVKARVKDLPAGFLASLNDQDGAFSVALASGTETAKTGKLFTVDFDRCEGAALPTPGDFACAIDDAVQDCGAPAGDVHCSVKFSQ
jgi:hypothetical protein